MSDVDEKALAAAQDKWAKTWNEYRDISIRTAIEYYESARTQPESKAEVWLTLDEYDALLRKANGLKPIAQPEAKGEDLEAIDMAGYKRGFQDCERLIKKEPWRFATTPHTDALRVAREALRQIAANTSDSGLAKGKEGASEVAASCGELACQALAEIAKLDNGL